VPDLNLTEVTGKKLGVKCRGYVLHRAHTVRGLSPEEGIRWELGCVKPAQWFMPVQNS